MPDAFDRCDDVRCVGRLWAGLLCWTALTGGAGAEATALAGQFDVPAVTAEVVDSDRFLELPERFDPPTSYRVRDEAPRVRFARYPLPETPADPWSHWGPGTVLPDGRVLTSVGDHRAIDGNAYLYVYDPRSHELRLAADVQSAVEGFEPGDFGFGKIHDRLNVGGDGKVYFGTYWGLRQGLEGEFKGERVFRYDPETNQVTDLGMPMEGWGYPSSHMSPEHGLYYAEATYRPDYSRAFMAFDVESREVRFRGEHEAGYGRDLFVDADGRAYYNNGERALMRYDPEANALEDLGPVMPVSRLRRTAGPDENGLLYATSADRDEEGRRVLFSFDPQTFETRTIAQLWSDTPAIALHPNGRHIYMVPGNVRYPGRPLIRADVNDGSIEVVAFLGPAIDETHDFTLGGTYSLAVDEQTAYIQFGLHDDLALVTVELPPAE